MERWGTNALAYKTGESNDPLTHWVQIKANQLGLQNLKVIMKDK